MKKHLLIAGIVGGFIFSSSAQVTGTYVNITGTDTDGVSQSIDQYLNAGKTVILDLFATWCVPCQQSVPIVDEIYAEAGPSGTNEIEILALEMDQATTDEAAYKATYGVSNPIIPMTSGMYSNYQWSGLGYAYPSFYVICPNGGYTGFTNSASLDSDIRGYLIACGVNINATAGISDNSTSNFSVTLLPNPITNGSEATLNIETSTNENADLVIFNEVGQIKSTTSAQLSSGMNTITLATSDLKAGLYFVKIQGETSTSSLKLLVN